MADYRGRLAEVKSSDSSHFKETGIIVEHVGDLFVVEFAGESTSFVRDELRIKRTKVTEAEYNVKLKKGQDSEYQDVEAGDPGMAANMAAGGDDYDSIEVAPDSKKGLPKGTRVEPLTKPKTGVRTTLEALRYPYTIALPLSEASLLGKKTKGIYGLSVKERYGRFYVTVENSDAMLHLYNKLDTKRKSRTTRAILEGIRRSAR